MRHIVYMVWSALHLTLGRQSLICSKNKRPSVYLLSQQEGLFPPIGFNEKTTRIQRKAGWRKAVKSMNHEDQQWWGAFFFTLLYTAQEIRRNHSHVRKLLITDQMTILPEPNSCQTWNPHERMWGTNIPVLLPLAESNGEKEVAARSWVFQNTGQKAAKTSLEEHRD